MLDKLAGIAARYEEVERLLGDPAVASDYTKVAEYAQERSSLQPIAEGYYEYRRVLEQIEEAKGLIESEDADLRQLAQEEMASLEARRDELDGELKRMLLPKDPRDEKNVILEIRAGTGILARRRRRGHLVPDDRP